MKPHTQTFADEYNHLRDQGETHNTIAQHFGIQRDSLMRRLYRHNLYRPEPHEKPTYQTLERLIETHATFTSHDLPATDPTITTSALNRARNRKQIRIVGTARNTHGHTRHIYTANLQATG